MPTLTYKEFRGEYAYDEAADLYHGEVVGLADVVTFQARREEDMPRALADSVEDYLEFRAQVAAQNKRAC